MLCSAKFSTALQTEIISTKVSDFLKQISFLKSFNSVFFSTFCFLSLKKQTCKVGSTLQEQNVKAKE